MRLERFSVSNWEGIEQQDIKLGKVNLITGAKGIGKSSFIDALCRLFTNQNKRTEVIKHRADEAKLFVECDNGLTVDKRIRADKAEYLKIRKGEEGVPSTESYLKSLVGGNIFHPMDWVNLSIQEQTKSILSMLQIGWSMEDIQKWFGEEPSNINFDQHILQILKAIETKYYKDREEVNREITEFKVEMNNLKKDMPAGYDGEKWRNEKVQEYYAKVTEAQKVNQYIEQAKGLKENFEAKVKALEADAENEKSRIQMKYKDQRQDIKDIVDLSKQKIEKAKDTLNGLDATYKQGLKSIELDEQKAIADLDAELAEKIEELKSEYAGYKEINHKKTAENKNKLKADLEATKEEQKDLINIQQNKISAKQQELISLDPLEKQEAKTIDEKKNAEIEKEKIRVGKAGEYLEKHEPVDIEPLQQKADEVSSMREYLHQWDMLIDIRDNKLAPKERNSAELTAKIEKARSLPQELLKTAKMPIEGISVDEKGLIRINGTLIDGLSDGEKLELAITIAKAQMGDLKVLCIDKFESLNPAEQKKLIEKFKQDDIQYIITQVTDGDFTVACLDDKKDNQ